MGSWAEEEVEVKGKNRRIRHTCISNNDAEDAEQISGSEVSRSGWNYGVCDSVDR